MTGKEFLRHWAETGLKSMFLEDEHFLDVMYCFDIAEKNPNDEMPERQSSA